MSGFTSVLKKIGQVLLKATEVSTEIMGFPFLSQLLAGHPNIPASVTTVTGDLNNIAAILSLMETAFPASGTGSQKLAASTPAIQQIVLLWAQSNLAGHNKVKVEATKFSADVAKFTSAFADILNDFGD
jgi:hypothetical protein